MNNTTTEKYLVQFLAHNKPRQTLVVNDIIIANVSTGLYDWTISLIIYDSMSTDGRTGTLTQVIHNWPTLLHHKLDNQSETGGIMEISITNCKNQRSLMTLELFPRTWRTSAVTLICSHLLHIRKRWLLFCLTWIFKFTHVETVLYFKLFLMNYDIRLSLAQGLAYSKQAIYKRHYIEI